MNSGNLNCFLTLESQNGEVASEQNASNDDDDQDDFDMGDDDGESRVEDYGDYTRECQMGTCVYCHRVFDSYAGLLVHNECYFLRKGVEALNMGRQPFCGKKFKFICEAPECAYEALDCKALSQHMKWHWGGQFHCKHCDHKAILESNMKRHVICHTGEFEVRPSTCLWKLIVIKQISRCSLATIVTCRTLANRVWFDISPIITPTSHCHNKMLPSPPEEVVTLKEFI